MKKILFFISLFAAVALTQCVEDEIKPQQAQINTVTRTPEVPEADAAVTVTVDVTDYWGLSSATIVYTVNDGAQQTAAMTIAADKMSATGTIPAQVAGAEVAYMVKVTNLKNLSTESGSFSYIAGQEQPFATQTYGTPAEGVDFPISINVNFQNKELAEVKFYFRINNGARQDVVLTLAGEGNYTATVPGAQIGKMTQIDWYWRVTDTEGTKYYYGTSAEFDKDLENTWPSVTEGTSINYFSGLHISRTLAGNDLSFDVSVTGGNVTEVKFYYLINSTNVVPDRLEIELAPESGQTRFTFTIPAADLQAGDVVRWYMRAVVDGNKNYFTLDKDATFDKDIVDDWHQLTIE